MDISSAQSQTWQRTRIKICGLKEHEHVQAAVQAGADALGFVFVQASPRFITPEQAGALCATVPAFISKVALFVDAYPAWVGKVVREMHPSLLQFHGKESPEYCAHIAQTFSVPYIKAFGVEPDATPESLLELAAPYASSASAFLFDTASPLHGGTGKVFDWSRLPASGFPLVLSGGLTAVNIAPAISQVRPFAVDVSSGVEIERGHKSSALIQAFCAAVRQADAIANKATQ